MEKRRLGKSDLQVSVLGMGCWQFGGGSYWGSQSQQDVNAVVHKALDSGINYFDTAEVYNEGASERSLGIALKGRRKEAIIGTKITPANMYPSKIRDHCENSLNRLATDYIDLYMVHWPVTSHAVAHFTDDKKIIADPPVIGEAFETLSRLQKEGKIRHIGISNHGIRQMKELSSAGASFAANELAYNLLSRAIEDSILPYCIENDIGVIGYMPLQQGLLSGKYKAFDEIKPMRVRSRHFHYSRGSGTRHGEEGAEEEIVQALQEIQKTADEIGVHIATLSLAWVIANRGIASTIVGSRNEAQLDINIQGALLQLNDEIVSKLNRVTGPVLQKLGFNPDYYENRNHSRIQ